MPTELEAPKTISEKGTIPATRIEDAEMSRSRVHRLINADETRSQRRALVKGLVDGNPPYKSSKLREAGRAYACNVNWRTAESYLSQAWGAFYDVFSETPTYSTVFTHFGTADERGKYGRTISEKFHCLIKGEYDDEDDWSWDYNMQVSQQEMVLYGNGPLWFNHKDDWRPEASLHAELKVPEMAKSTTHKWEECARVCTYLPHELYGYILNEKAAADVGWSVELVKKAIMHAHPKTRDMGVHSTWEWHQQRLKNQSFEYSAESAVIETGHYFVKEFPKDEDKVGKITQVIVLISPSDSTTTTVSSGGKSTTGYLYRKERYYTNWRELVHPMYYASDGGGYHHSVTGMGVKMYSAMEYQNRLLCNLADKTFAPKILFKPTSAESGQSLNLVQFGDYGKVPAGFDYIQTPTQSFIEDGIVFNREMSRMVASNLSQYRQEARKEDGNPPTAAQIVHDAQQQARLGKTQLNRYYAQMDGLYNEMFRRAAKAKLNSNIPGAKAALRFQEECEKAGVPKEALKSAYAKATRITGQGSDFMRQQSLEFLLGMVAMLPEDGRENLTKDVIAARAGQAMVERYFPGSLNDQKPTDHHALATLQVAAMKEGVPPVITGTQNHVIYAQVFLQAAAMSMDAVAQRKADPVEVLAFIDLAGPAIVNHLEAIKNDPTRKAAYDALLEQWEKLAKAADALTKQLEQAAQKNGERRQAQARAQAIQQNQDPETNLKAAEMQAKLKMAQDKTQQALRQKEQKHSQAMVIADAKTAEEIRRKRASESETETANTE